MKLPRYENIVQSRKNVKIIKRVFLTLYLLSSLKPADGDSGGEANTGGAVSGGVQASSAPLRGSPF